MTYLRDWIALPRVQAFIQEEYPDDDIPDLDTLMRNTALQITHSTLFTGDGLRPVHPQTILAGLMTCAPAPRLSGDLATWVQGAEHGVILVSFGSVITASKMPEEKRIMMLEVFSRLKQRVIWKWEEDMTGLPDNVMVSAWLPQTSLLAHPNVRLFITHGGMGSIQETLCHKTPIVGVPVHGDQHPLVKGAVTQGWAVSIDWKTVTGAGLEAAIREVLDNPGYKEAVVRLSDLVMDQPLHPLERTVWWMEYLLRFTTIGYKTVIIDKPSLIPKSKLIPESLI